MQMTYAVTQDLLKSHDELIKRLCLTQKTRGKKMKKKGGDYIELMTNISND